MYQANKLRENGVKDNRHGCGIIKTTSCILISTQ